MKRVLFDLGRQKFSINAPDKTDILAMGPAPVLPSPQEKIRQALKTPIGSKPLDVIVRQKLSLNTQAKAVVVISDGTRPVPYSGSSGVLFPVVEELMKAGLKSSQIFLLVATGTHRPMTEAEIKERLDPRLLALGLKIINHNCRNKKDLVSVGRTEIGGEILVNRYYVQSEIKILTGLVESHFMAGASGGRKSICPGLLGEASIHLLHSGPVLASPLASDLILEGNPVHEEALRVARMAGCDFIVNVTLDSYYRLTGVFAGDMEKAHLAAFERLRSYAAIPFHKKYDLVLGHTGYVGVNHYQAAKGALTCSPLLKKNSLCLLVADHSDFDPIGGPNYKQMMRLLAEVGPKKFVEMIVGPGWKFTPDQWEAQMWSRFLQQIPSKNLIYCCQDIAKEDFNWLPGTDARTLSPQAKSLPQLVQSSLDWALQVLRKRLKREPDIALLADGPYGIPQQKIRLKK